MFESSKKYETQCGVRNTDNYLNWGGLQLQCDTV
jgi:hypothetical protein